MSIPVNSTMNIVGVIKIYLAVLILQAHRPFVNYYTFEDASLRRLEEVPQYYENLFTFFAYAVMHRSRTTKI